MVRELLEPICIIIKHEVHFQKLFSRKDLALTFYLGYHRDSVHAVLVAEYSYSHDRKAKQVHFEVVVIVLCKKFIYILDVKIIPDFCS